MNTTHSPLPWFANGPWHIQATSPHQDSLPIVVAQVIKGHHISDDERSANSRFIVTACNSHAALLGALEDCLQSLTRLPDVDGAFRVTCIQQAKKAIELAGGKQ